MKKFIIILCLLLLSSCVSIKHTKSYTQKRGLMLLQPNEFARNKPLKYSKVKALKILRKKIKRQDNRHR